MFDKCCLSPNIVSYNLKHSPKPFSYESTVEEAIKLLLLYMPNIDSTQSEELEDLNNALYDDFIFSYLLSALGMSEENDVKWYDRKDDIPDDEWNFYRNNFCLNCQKIIICRIASHTKTKNLLRCIRNCIAHGDFVVKADILLGFNSDHGHNKAIIKIKHLEFVKAIKRLISPHYAGMIKEELFAFAFSNLGYSVIQASSPNVHYDLALAKDGKEYFIELKVIKGQRYLHKEHIEKMLVMSDNLSDNQNYVLIIDTSRITKEVKSHLNQYPRFYLLDIDKIKELLSGIDALDSLANDTTETV